MIIPLIRSRSELTINSHVPDSKDNLILKDKVHEKKEQGIVASDIYRAIWDANIEEVESKNIKAD